MKLLKIALVLSLLLSTEVLAKKKKKRKVGQIKKKDKNIMTNRVESKDFDYLSFGPTWFHSLGRASNSDASFQLGAGRIWESNPNAAVKFGGDVAFHPEFNQFLGGLGLGANYYFNATDFSPFVGADLGMSYFYNSQNPDNVPNLDPDSGFGFQMGVSGGFALFRTSTTQLLVEPNLKWQLRGSYPVTLGIKLSIASPSLFSGF